MLSSGGGSVEIAWRYDSQLHHALRKTGPLYVLRQFAQVELGKQCPHVHLDCLNAEVQLVRDLLVRGRSREPVIRPKRATQRDQHPALDVGQRLKRDSFAGRNGARHRSGPHGPVDKDRPPETDTVAVSKTLATTNPSTVHVSAIR